MAWRGPTVAAAVAALLLAAPQGAAAQTCQVPKAWETAAVQLEYDLALELGLLEQHTEHLRRQPSSALPGALLVYTGQRVQGTAVLAGALARFGTTVAGTPPECGGGAAAKSRRR